MTDTEHGQLSIDALSAPDALTVMLASHEAAMRCVMAAQPAILEAARRMAATLASGGTLHYAAAGSSGLMALADASELPGTFGISQSQIRVCMAGGVPVDGRMPGNTEDDSADGAQAAQALKDGDLAIVLSASGTTPYACAFAETARLAGHSVIGIANIPGSALLTLATVAITLPTAAEVIAGSTRLGAGTAQKVALNMMSTQAGTLLGHVHDGMMVNLNPDNIKLRARATDIVCAVARVPRDAAEAALLQADFDTKCAILIAMGVTPESARHLLGQAKGRLRDILPGLAKSTTPVSS